MWDMLWTTAGNEDNARQTINTRIDQSLFTCCMVPCRRKQFLPAVSAYLYKKFLFLSRVFIETYRIKEFTGRGRVVSGRLLWFNDRIMKMIRHKSPAVTVLTFDRLDKLPESISLAG